VGWIRHGSERAEREPGDTAVGRGGYERSAESAAQSEPERGRVVGETGEQVWRELRSDVQGQEIEPYAADGGRHTEKGEEVEELSRKGEEGLGMSRTFSTIRALIQASWRTAGATRKGFESHFLLCTPLVQIKTRSLNYTEPSLYMPSNFIEGINA
jgi:hypothetical protein